MPSKVWLLLILTILTSLIDGFGLSMLAPLLESLNMGQQTELTFLNELTEFLGISNSLPGILALIFIIFLFKAIFKFSTNFYANWLHKKLSLNLKTQFFDFLLKTDYQYFTTRNTGYFITAGVSHTKSFVASFLIFISLISSIIIAVTYIVIAALISVKVSLIAILFGGITLGALTIINRYVKKLSHSISNEQKKLNQITIQAIQAFKFITSTASSKTIKEAYVTSTNRLVNLNFKNRNASSFSNAISELLIISTIIIILIIEVIFLKYPISSVLVVLFLFNRAVNSILSIQTIWQNLISKLAFVQSVDTEITNLKQHKSISGQRILSTKEINQQLQLKNLSFKYASFDKMVIEQVSLTIAPNTSVAFVGDSGAGKTTLVDLITGLLKPTHGQVLVGKTPLKEYQISSWQSNIGYVTQDLTIFDDTIANNITLFHQNADQKDIENVAKMAFADEFIQTLPEGYNTQIGDKGVRLSGGQKQRLFIARELYRQPSILILDEATSALDSKSEKYIQNSIDSLKGKLTVIIIAHRLSTIKNVDKIFVLDKGKIVEADTFENLLNSKNLNVFKKMVAMQSF